MLYPFFIRILLFLTCVILSSNLSASDLAKDLLRGVLVEGINVDLREPTFCDGVLTTEKGGVITGPKGIRIQARKMIYTRKQVDGVAVCTIEAEDDLMVEFGRYVFVGQRLEYDFQTQTGVIFCGRTGIMPWYIGGNAIQLCSDGSYIVYQAFLTTSENEVTDWQITADQVRLREERFIEAKDVKFHFIRMPIFWLPCLNLDLETMFDSPFEYTLGWGGRQGPRVGVGYEIFSTELWRTWVRFDYRLKRGVGGGFETEYLSADRRASLETINYVAQDSSIFIRHERFRYRFQGAYSNSLLDDKLTVNLTYDKLSDKDMSTDYEDQELELEIDGRTELDIRRQEEIWISNLMTRVRVNNFETLKQELPTFQTSWHPFVLGSTGIISDNQVNASYLDFVYANQIPDTHDYNSVRVGFNHRLYRSFPIQQIIVTPEVGTRTVFYGNSRGGEARWAVLGTFGCDLNMPFYRFYDRGKHVIAPYSQYKYYTFPTSSPDEHYIFDINDGLYRLNMLRFGVQQSFYTKNDDGLLRRFVSADLYTNAFFDTKTIHSVIPRGYAELVFYPAATLRHVWDIAWNFERSEIDHINFRTEWTFNPNFAISAEYRHRESYDWRKVDRTNFILESFRSTHELRRSQLSDRRDTALLHFFYRFHPNWAIEYESRHGWHRRDRTRYNEFEIDLLATLRSAIQTRLSYQHNEGEDRVAVYFSMGAHRPDRMRAIDYAPYLEF